MDYFLACESSQPVLLRAPGKHAVTVHLLRILYTQYSLLMAEECVFSAVLLFFFFLLAEYFGLYLSF